MHRAISQIDEVTQQNAALVEETSAAAKSMSEQSDILAKDMSFFKTGKAVQIAAPKASDSKAALPAPKKAETKSADKPKATQPEPVRSPNKPSPAPSEEDEWGEF